MKPKIITTRNLKPKVSKPDPAFKPYDGPALTTGNMGKFKLLEADVIVAEDTLEVPVIPEKELLGMKTEEFDDLPEKQASEIDSKGQTRTVEGLCKAETQAGNPCKLRAVKNGFCQIHGRGK